MTPTTEELRNAEAVLHREMKEAETAYKRANETWKKAHMLWVQSMSTEDHVKVVWAHVAKEVGSVDVVHVKPLLQAYRDLRGEEGDDLWMPC